MKKFICLLCFLGFSFCAFSYDRTIYFGQAHRDDKGEIVYIEENQSQTHSKENYVIVKVKNIKPRHPKQEIGRIRIAVWDSKENYAKEGIKPFRAVSYQAKEVKNGELSFKVSGLEVGKSYSFFAHFDKENQGKVARVLGIPKDPYIFSNGLKRKGFGPPEFEKTLVKFLASGQIVELNF